MKKIILGFVGEKLSGKGTVAEHLKKTCGASVHRFSIPMRDCVKRLHLPLTRENLITFSVITRKAFGEDLYAKVIADDSKEDHAEIVAVDGVRYEADISELRKLDGFHLVYITAPAKTRFGRMKTRGENAGETEMSWEAFMEEEKAPTEIAIPELGATAEFVVENDGSFEELYAKVDGIISYLKSL